MNVLKSVLRFLHRGLCDSALLALHAPSIADYREYISGTAIAHSRPATLLLSVGRQVAGGPLTSAEERVWEQLVAQLTGGRGAQDD
ncbi:MAG TPA: hypothetical protein VFU65_17930 [Actinocrinis sp.]|nr:hypothetical protein [Actinocrinis sp.]